MNIFSYPGKPGKIQEIEINPIGNIKRKILLFPSWVKTPYKENNVVHIDIWEPANFSSAVFIVHSWMEKERGYSKKLALFLSRQGFLSLRIHLPYHLSRTPEGKKSGSLFFTPNLDTSLNSFLQSVIDLRTSIDVLEERYKIDKIGGVGTSLGAIILLTLIGVDERIKCGVSILGAGNVTDIVAKGIATLPLMISGYKKGLRWRHYRKVHEEFENFLKEVKEKGVENVIPPWEWFLYDPLTYANKNKNIFFINALFDLVVPLHCVIRTLKAFGNPEIFWLPSTHFTSSLFFPLIEKKTLKFLKANCTSSEQGIRA